MPRASEASRSTIDLRSPIMLAGDWVPADTHQFDLGALPRVPSQHAVVSDVRARPRRGTELDVDAGGVNQHNYLTHFDNRFWAMWSDGPGIEDRAGQRVKYATSRNGIEWTEPRYLTPAAPGSGPDSEFYGQRTDQGLRYISRGFWQRDEDLLALASLDEAAGFFGPSLTLHAFRWVGSHERWEPAGIVYRDAINNFPPEQLPGGQWMMSRRPHNYRDTGVQFLVGGVESIDAWASVPVLGSSTELSAEEPHWWALPGGDLVALFRDGRRSGYLYRSFSRDEGRTWSLPVQTNFPDATAKFSSVRLADGRYLLVSNPNPRKRDPLALSISNDGLVFHAMAHLVGGRWVDYPHVIEHEDHLLIAFAGGKQSVEVLKIKTADLDGLRNAPTSHG